MSWAGPGPLDPPPADCPAGATRDLRTAALAAMAGGVAARPLYRTDDLGVRQKRPGDPVTEADHAANAAILSVLAERASDDPVRSEESDGGRVRGEAAAGGGANGEAPRADSPAAPAPPGRPGAPVPAHERLWIVDPLDGTKEFIARNGEFAVMVGLAVRGAARLGAVLVPARGHLYLGLLDEAADGRAWRADVTWPDRNPDERGAASAAVVGSFEPLRLPSTRPAGRLMMVRSRSHPDPITTTLIERLGAASMLSGSAGVKCAIVADGAADLYVHPIPWIKEWDTCAPEAVLRGAGGRVTDCAGAALTYGKTDPAQREGILAARPDAWAMALPLVREATAARRRRTEHPRTTESS